MAAASSKKLPRVQPKTYTTCLLYHTDKAKEKMKGLTLAACNPRCEKRLMAVDPEITKDAEANDICHTDLSNLSVSDKMSCNYCDITFQNRLEQKRHYRSDWHRYNLKLRIHGKTGVSEEQFETISGNISSLSGSDTEDDTASDMEAGSDSVTTKRLLGASLKLDQSINSSTDSESEMSNQMEEAARRLPKVYFKNKAGELLSLYRCVIAHKKSQPSTTDDLIARTTKLPDEMNWAIFMAGGGHFAGAVFSKDKLIVHKTFHRYVVRAKRGTAQSSRDSQGNAPKSGGASLRRYNEAALTEEIQALIQSWKDELQTCDRIFLRAPSFNRKIFFGGKTPPFQKDDLRIRLIPFQTRRPTFNEVRRVFEMLASIECYGDETDIQDFIPISPPQVFNRETGQLETKDETQLSPRHCKLLNKKLRTSPLVGENNREEKAVEKGREKSEKSDRKMSPLPGHVLEDENQSSGTSTASDTELVETMLEISTMDLKEHAATKKPKRKKKSGRKRGGLQKCQTEPESNVMEEERYHLKNSLYTACKIGDLESLKSLLAVFLSSMNHVTTNTSTEIGNKVDTSRVIHSKNHKTMECSQSVGYADALTKDMINFNESKEDNGESKSNSVNGLSNPGTFSKRIDDKKEARIEVTQQALIIKSTDIEGESSTAKTSSEKSCSMGDQRTLESVNLGAECCDKNDMECSSDNGITTLSTGIESDTYESNSISVSKTSQSDREEMSNVDTENEKSIKTDTLTWNKQCDDKHALDCDTDNKDQVAKSNSFEQSNQTENQSSQFQNETDSVIYDTSLVPTKLQLSDTSPNRLTGQKVGGVSMSSLKDLSPVITESILNEPFGDHDTTLLHVASREGQNDVINLLMESGASPSTKDIFGQTPYMVSKDKSVRNEFRKFMGKWPEKYDYSQSQIPAPLSEEREAEKRKKDAERKKLKQKEKKERMKVKKEEEDKKKAEERERQRYLNLSDREKRALAAERRLLQQVSTQGGDKPILSRCFQCATDMTGKVPFEYNDNKFCSPKCLQLHRKAQTSKS